MGDRLLAATLVVAALVASACAGAPPPAGDTGFIGRYTVSGGGGALPVVKDLTAAFSKRYPQVVWVIEDVGSDAGVELTASRRVDLGMISRELKDEERSRVSTVPIGVSGTAVAVNASNSVTNLSKSQVRDIFAGATSDWSKVGGPPGKITVLVREVNSVTRSSFESYFFGGSPAYSKDAIEVYEIEETIKALHSFRDSIGMVTSSDRTWNDKAIRLVAIDGTTPTRDNIASGSYKLRRALYLVNHPTTIRPVIAAFLDFVRGPEGQRIITGP